MTPHCLTLVFSLACTSLASAQSDDTLRWWPPQDRPAQMAMESALSAVPTGPSLRTYHELFASEPHVAGTEGDLRNIERLTKAFVELGLEVHVHEFWAYLAYPEDAAVEVIGAGADGANLSLSLKERDLAEDSYDDDPALTIGWNAYSGSGDITASIVYVNYGTREDFQALAKLGIDLNGKILLARYGGNFRGYKAKFAEAAGAAGLIIFTDPKDSGFVKGDVYPEGGWANDSYIQRGSIKALDYSGDPLTPFEPATEDARRRNINSVALPKIPVQPIGYGAAQEILSRMNGDPLPEEFKERWQGGLPMEYKLSGGDLRVRLMVKQNRKVTRTANVLAELPGAIFPDEKIYIGCHHDAWCHGAGDPLAGTMLLYEAAKSFVQAMKDGHRPARTIVFANWGAEEFGIIGSTEYVEQYRDELTDQVIAYINLDAATMGPNFHSSASPSLKQLIMDVTKLVPQAGAEEGTKVFDAWRGEKDEPSIGNLGGGSDHIGFYCHLGIPSCGIGSGGAPGTAYHSNYDNIAWYQKTVGEDYEPAIMLTRVVNRLAARLANAPILPLDMARYAKDGRTHLHDLAARAKKLEFEADLLQLQEWLVGLQVKSQSIQEQLLEAIGTNLIPPNFQKQVNQRLFRLEKCWLSDEGLPERPWYRNLYAATDPYSGYAAWMLPALRYAIEAKDEVLVREQIDQYRIALRRLEQVMSEIPGLIPGRAFE
ncbi:MAG: M28 family peptidase [Planctomycetota bacterium]|nr:M28 family peptidase [Planctomycetota bacterium]